MPRVEREQRRRRRRAREAVGRWRTRRRSPCSPAAPRRRCWPRRSLRRRPQGSRSARGRGETAPASGGAQASPMGRPPSVRRRQRPGAARRRRAGSWRPRWRRAEKETMDRAYRSYPGSRHRSTTSTTTTTTRARRRKRRRRLGTEVCKGAGGRDCALPRPLPGPPGVRWRSLGRAGVSGLVLRRPTLSRGNRLRASGAAGLDAGAACRLLPALPSFPSSAARLGGLGFCAAARPGSFRSWF